MNHLKSHFLIDPGITYLNFGSFGACPKPVFENYQNWQRELEAEPVQFITVKGPKYLEASRKALSEYVHCKADDLVFVPNPTHALNIIAKSLKLQSGDEVLSTNLEYGACDRTWNYYCSQKGAKYIQSPVKLPLSSKEEFVHDFLKGITPKTKVVFISHLTSSTALIFPVKEICDFARSNNILCIVDGAHVPGHIALDIEALGADIYTGACHKWMMTPKGCSFLYVRKELQELFDPLVISWGYNSDKPSRSRFLDYHQMQGTRDFSAYLTVPKALEFMKEHNWESVSENCKDLVIANAPRFAEILGSKPLAPLNKDFTGQMLSLEIKCSHPEKLYSTLFSQYKIEIPVIQHSDKVYLRYSIHALNTQTDLDALYQALSEIRQSGELLS